MCGVYRYVQVCKVVQMWVVAYMCAGECAWSPEADVGNLPPLPFQVVLGMNVFQTQSSSIPASVGS